MGSSPALAISPPTTLSVSAPRLFIAAGLTETTAVTSTAASITFSFNIPLTLGGLTVSGYRLSILVGSSILSSFYCTANGIGSSATSGSASIAIPIWPNNYAIQTIVTGLTYSTTYTISLVATYTQTSSFTSPALDITQTTATLSAPVISGTTTSTATSITFSFTAPTTRGGLTISGYRVWVSLNSSPVDFTYLSTNYTAGNFAFIPIASVPLAATGIVTVSGLEASISGSIKTYNISLVATYNQTSLFTSPALAITQATVIITAPVLVGTPTSSPTFISFVFTHPASVGGLSFQGYKISVSLNSSPVAFSLLGVNYSAGQSAPITVPTSGTTRVIQGLEYSTTSITKTYTISIVLTYTGVSYTSPALVFTQATSIPTVPGAPVTSTSSGNGTTVTSDSIRYRFYNSSDTGGIPIISYTLSYFSSTPTIASPTFIVRAVSDTPYSDDVTVLRSQVTVILSTVYELIISGLTYSTIYTFRLYANNDLFRSTSFATITQTPHYKGAVTSFTNSTTFAYPTGICVGQDGNIYVASKNNHQIYKVTPTGVISNFAGSTQGYNDGTTNSRFNTPMGMAADSSNNIYVADMANNRIRKVTLADAVVSTVAGGGGGFSDGTGANALFLGPQAVAVGPDGNIYVSDTGNNCIRKMIFNGTAWVVTTIAGRTQGYADGTGVNASFYRPMGLAVAQDGTIYVADQGNLRIRKVTPTGVVTTLAGSGVYGSANGLGTNAEFYNPSGVALFSDGSICVTEASGYGNVRMVSPHGVVTRLAGGATLGLRNGIGDHVYFAMPIDVAIDANNNAYITDASFDANRNNNCIRKMTLSSTHS